MTPVASRGHEKTSPCAAWSTERASDKRIPHGSALLLKPLIGFKSVRSFSICPMRHVCYADTHVLGCKLSQLSGLDKRVATG